VPDYTEDVSMTIDEWKVRCTVKSLSHAYNNKGRATKTETTVTTADLDIQPVTRQQQMYMKEIGWAKPASHVMYGYYDTSDVKIVVSQGDRIYDASNNLYQVLQVSDFSGSHLEIFVLYVEGKA